jgi:hypothetical protein
VIVPLIPTEPPNPEAAMRRLISISALLIGTAIVFASPTANADCDITTTKCHKNNGKCNIKFRNITDQATGSGKGTYLTQKSLAQQIRVKAVRDDGKAAGNILNIEAGTSKTMNIDKKYNKDFAQIRLSAPTFKTGNGITMTCNEVKAVLNGNGTCKVFNGATNLQAQSFRSQLGFSCDAGKVLGPTFK